jgi:hypothetical protein
VGQELDRVPDGDRLDLDDGRAWQDPAGRAHDDAVLAAAAGEHQRPAEGRVLVHALDRPLPAPSRKFVEAVEHGQQPPGRLLAGGHPGFGRQLGDPLGAASTVLAEPADHELGDRLRLRIPGGDRQQDRDGLPATRVAQQLPGEQEHQHRLARAGFSQDDELAPWHLLPPYLGDPVDVAVQRQLLPGLLRLVRLPVGPDDRHPGGGRAAG